MGKGFPQVLLWLFLGVILPSCTTINFEGRGLIPLYLTNRPEHNKFLELKGRKEFYLWGLIGPDDTVYMDEEFYNNGLASVASINIQEYQKTSSFLKAFFSLGFFIPKDYIISGKGIAPGTEL